MSRSPKLFTRASGRLLGQKPSWDHCVKLGSSVEKQRHAAGNARKDHSFSRIPTIPTAPTIRAVNMVQLGQLNLLAKASAATITHPIPTTSIHLISVECNIPFLEPIDPGLNDMG